MQAKKKQIVKCISLNSDFDAYFVSSVSCCWSLIVIGVYPGQGSLMFSLNEAWFTKRKINK